MKVLINMIPREGRKHAKTHPKCWEAFVLLAREYQDISTREVRVAWEWFANGWEMRL